MFAASCNAGDRFSLEGNFQTVHPKNLFNDNAGQQFVISSLQTNLIQIAHNDEIGSHTVMAAQAGIAGSTKIGEWCMIGGQVGIAGHSKIGDKVGLGAQSGVPGDIKSGSQLIGTPPMELKQYFKASVAQRSLPDMQKELRNLRKEIEELKQLLNK